MVLQVLGDDPAEIGREAKIAPTWLYAVLSNRPEAQGEHREHLLRLLDKLARFGNVDAVKFQRELEARDTAVGG